MLWVQEKADFERRYWSDLIAQTNGDMQSMVRLSGQGRTNIHKILNRNALKRPIAAKYARNFREGNWVQHGL
jgi:hypothetical protein